VIILNNDQLDADDGASDLFDLGAGVTSFDEGDGFTGADCGEAGIVLLSGFFKTTVFACMVDERGMGIFGFSFSTEGGTEVTTGALMG